MAMQRRLRVAHGDVFPSGAFLKGQAEPVLDFKAAKRDDGSRPQVKDPDSGLLLWQVVVLDADEVASKRETALSVKIPGKVAPVPPENKTGSPWTPVEFVGLTALPYVEDSPSGGRGRIAWSYRADGMVAPGQAGKDVA
jgi:hypothetical protein